MKSLIVALMDLPAPDPPAETSLEQENARLREEIARLRAALRAAATEADPDLGAEAARRAAAAAELKKREEQLRLVADFSPALISYVDRDERYQFMNRLYTEWFGFEPEQVLGKTILEVVGPVAYEKARRQIQDARRGRHVHFENHVVMKDGSTKDLDLQFVPFLQSSGEMNGFIILGYDISERRRTELALRESEARYRRSQEQLKLALESAQMQSWHIDLRTGRISTSLDSESVLEDQSAAVEVDAAIARLLRCEDATEIVGAIRAAVDNHSTYAQEYRIVRADGKSRWIMSRGSPRYDGDGAPVSMSGVMADITERKQTEDLYRAITELTPQFVWMSDEKGYITFSNSTLLNYMGVEQEQTMGDRWIDTLHPDDRERTMQIWQQALSTGSPYEIEFRIRSKEGGYGWFLNRALPLHDQMSGRIDRWLGVSTDITERKAIESQLQATVHELEHERDLRERFVAMLTHDLRTPLTAIKMSAHLLARKSEEPERIRRIAARIADNIDRADRMISDVLDASLIRAGERLPLEIAPCHLNLLAAEILEELSTIHGDRFVLVADAEIRGHWSPIGLRRVLENLCNNAIKYGASQHAVVVSLAQTADRTTIAVHNHGSPISPEDQSTLFDAFKRTDSAQRGGQHGWGLGLTLVKGLAESHGGSVSVESAAGRGTTFTITLPTDARQPVSYR